MIRELREELQRQVGMAEEWRERYMVVKRLERRKVGKKVEEEEEKGEKGEKGEEMEEEGVVYVPYLLKEKEGTSGEGKRKFVVKNT